MEMANRFIKEAEKARSKISVDFETPVSFTDLVEMLQRLKEPDRAVVLLQAMRGMQPAVILAMYNRLVQDKVRDLVFEDEAGLEYEEEGEDFD